MKLFFCFVTFLMLLQLCSSILDWWNSGQLSWLNRKRLMQLESQMMADLDKKIAAIHPIRFMYEESPHYEIGYVLGEVMERYRKMVDMVYRVNNYPDQLFHTLRNLQQQQHYYQEGYNLICMLHEIPKKYGHIKGFELLMEAVETGDTEKVHETYEAQKIRGDIMAKHRKRQAAAKRSRVKNMKKALAIDELLRQVWGDEGPIPDDLLTNLSPEKLRKATKRPIKKPKYVVPKGRLYEYGWELNYEWWGK